MTGVEESWRRIFQHSLNPAATPKAFMQVILRGELLSGYVPGLGVGGHGAAGYDDGGDSSRPLLRALRSGNLFSKRGTAVLDAPEPDRAQMGAKSAGSNGGRR